MQNMLSGSMEPDVAVILHLNCMDRALSMTTRWIDYTCNGIIGIHLAAASHVVLYDVLSGDHENCSRAM